jgi:hypothetical protein
MSSGRRRRRTETALHPDTVDFAQRVSANGGDVSFRDIQAIDKLFVRPIYRQGLRSQILACNLLVPSPSAAQMLNTMAVKLWHPPGNSSPDVLNNFILSDGSRSGGLNPGSNNSTKFINTQVPGSLLSGSDNHLGYYSLSNNVFSGNREIGQALSTNLELIIDFGANNAFYRPTGTGSGPESVNLVGRDGFVLGSKSTLASTFIARRGTIYGLTNNQSTAEINSNNVTVIRGAFNNFSSRPCAGYSLGFYIPPSLQAEFNRIWEQMCNYFGRVIS